MTDAMERGRFSQPGRNGDVVERVLGPGRPNMHAFLEHLHGRGFDMAPRFLGLTEDGTRERLSFMHGQTGYPPLAPQLRSDATLASVAQAARRLHDASQGFIAPEPGQWSAHDYAGPVQPDCVGHLDLAPWNITFDGEQVTGLIDWDFAAPTSRAWDLAYVAHQFVPFHPSEGWPRGGGTSSPTA